MKSCSAWCCGRQTNYRPDVVVVDHAAHTLFNKGSASAFAAMMHNIGAALSAWYYGLVRRCAACEALVWRR
jgi:predicted MFS family arabinose efflux permease